MDLGMLLVVLAVTFVLIGAGVLAMAIGVIFRRPCLRGSCGGTACSCRGETAAARSDDKLVQPMP
jgi:hypothetical protein